MAKPVALSTIRLVVMAFVMAVSLAGILVASLTHFFHPFPEYGVVIDAGSTGSEAYVFTWQRRLFSTEAVNLTAINGTSDISVEPGINSFVNNTDGISAYLSPLLTAINSLVPYQYQPLTPVYFYCTGGMRELDESDQQLILNSVDTFFMNTSFSYSKGQGKVISGVDEGVYGWLSVNFIINKLNVSGNASRTVGALDMGGASTQITFVPTEKPSVSPYNLTVYQQTFELYAQSYLGWGINQAALTASNILVASLPDNVLHREDETHHAADGSGSLHDVPAAAVMAAREVLTTSKHRHLSIDYLKYFREDPLFVSAAVSGNVSHPCLPLGYNETTTVGDANVVFVGTSDPAGCLALTSQVVEGSSECTPLGAECGMDGVYQSPLTNATFYAFSGYDHAPAQFGLGPSLSLNELLNRTTAWCEMSWESILSEYGNSSSASYLMDYCFQGSYIYNILTEGYGFPDTTTQIEFVPVVKNVTLGWALGAMLIQADSLPSGPVHIVYFWWGVLILVLSSMFLFGAAVSFYYEIKFRRIIVAGGFISLE